MMRSDDSIKCAYNNLVTQNTLYQMKLSTHQRCNNCIACNQNNNIFSDVNQVSDCETNLAGIIQKTCNGSPERSSFSTKLFNYFECRCGKTWNEKEKLTVNLTIPKLTQAVEFESLVNGDSIHSPDIMCKRLGCRENKAKSKYKIQENVDNLVFSLDWKSRDSQSLSCFLLSVKSKLELNNLFKNKSVVYLHGFIASGTRSYIYVQLAPCVLFPSLETKNLIYSDYLIFSLLQYSLFPVVLVYNQLDNQSDFCAKIEKYKTPLIQYQKFLTGDFQLSEDVCFYCWNTAHQTCNDFAIQGEWRCSCGTDNSCTTLFCEHCRSPYKLKDQEETCYFCLQNIKSIYCSNCSFINSCSTCSKDILKTQNFACFDCKKWVNSAVCEKCDLVPSQVQCKECFSGKEELCSHNLGKNCILCSYDISCGVCWKPQLANKNKYCWVCSRKLLDGMCIKCRFYPYSNSNVCSECVKTQNKCGLNHIITLQSIAECDYCKISKKLFCEICSLVNCNCSFREFCRNCRTDLNEISADRISALLGSEILGNLQLCYFCYLSSNKCKCGNPLNRGMLKCDECYLVIDKKDKVLRFVQSGENGKRCKICDFDNKPNVIFCENCDCDLKFSFSNKSYCGVCGDAKVDKYCSNCCKQENCSICSKHILVGQNKYCRVCNSLVFNRICRNCKVITPKTHIVCYICSLYIWTCECLQCNPGYISKCINCNKNRALPCVICNQQSPALLETWRMASHKPLVNDVFVCRSCSPSLPSCQCGCKFLPKESICFNCELVLEY